MRDIGLDSFSVHDVLKPEASKVVVILSAVINFARFREEKLTLFDELNQQSVKEKALYASYWYRYLMGLLCRKNTLRNMNSS